MAATTPSTDAALKVAARAMPFFKQDNDVSVDILLPQVHCNGLSSASDSEDQDDCMEDDDWEAMVKRPSLGGLGDDPLFSFHHMADHPFDPLSTAATTVTTSTPTNTDSGTPKKHGDAGVLSGHGLASGTGGSSCAGGAVREPGAGDTRAERLERRRKSNRESARRMRAFRAQQMSSLQQEAEWLRGEKQRLDAEQEAFEREYASALQDNMLLRKRLLQLHNLRQAAYTKASQADVMAYAYPSLPQDVPDTQYCDTYYEPAEQEQYMLYY